MAKFKNALKPGADDENKLWNKSQSLQSLRSLWVPAILGLGLLGAMVSFLLRKRHAPWQWSVKKTVRTRVGSDKQPGYFLEFLSMCETHGHTRSKGQTLMEFHQHLKRSRFCDDHFDDLVVHYYKSRYEDAPKDESGEQGFIKRIREFGKTMS